MTDVAAMVGQMHWYHWCIGLVIFVSGVVWLAQDYEGR